MCIEFCISCSGVIYMHTLRLSNVHKLAFLVSLALGLNIVPKF